jgi:hypothetical protein
VLPGPGWIFGTENFGNKFPGDAAVYMGIVHVAIYEAAVAIKGDYEPNAPTPAAPEKTSLRAAIATAAYVTLTGLHLGVDQTILDNDYDAYLAAVPDGTAKMNGISVGRWVAQTVLALRANDGRDCSITKPEQLNPPAPGPGVWQPNPTGPVFGLCLPGMRPLALHSASQFRPGPPNALTSPEYAATSTRSRSSAGSSARSGRPSRRPKRSSGPTTTSGNGTTACSASPPRVGSTPCRPPACWRWRTSRAATR